MINYDDQIECDQVMFKRHSKWKTLVNRLSLKLILIWFTFELI